MQIDLTTWLFTGGLAFDTLFIQLSWHCGKITFFCFFLIHTFIQFTNSNGANTTSSCRADERTMHWKNTQIEHFSVLSTNETDKSWQTPLSYTTQIFTLIAVGTGSSCRFHTSTWFLQAFYHSDPQQGQHNHPSLLGLHPTAQPSDHKHPKMPYSSTGGSDLFFTLHTIQSGGFVLQINFEFLSLGTLRKLPNKWSTFN